MAAPRLHGWQASLACTCQKHASTKPSESSSCRKASSFGASVQTATGHLALPCERIRRFLAPRPRLWLNGHGYGSTATAMAQRPRLWPDLRHGPCLPVPTHALTHAHTHPHTHTHARGRHARKLHSWPAVAKQWAPLLTVQWGVDIQTCRHIGIHRGVWLCGYVDTQTCKCVDT